MISADILSWRSSSSVFMSEVRVDSKFLTTARHTAPVADAMTHSIERLR